jgi:hypothetical protein
LRIPTLIIEKNIVRLDISVKNHLPVHDVYSLEKLAHHVLDLLERAGTLSVLEELG